jgi:hypothetical protein
MICRIFWQSSVGKSGGVSEAFSYNQSEITSMPCKLSMLVYIDTVSQVNRREVVVFLICQELEKSL